MKLQFRLLVQFLLLFIHSFLFCNNINAQSSLKLWYNKPATKWVEALPLGNGHIGAMVFGGVDEELIQLNENVTYHRELFTSAPLNALVIRITSAHKGALNFDVTTKSQLRYRLFAKSNNEIVVNGKAPTHVDPSYYNPKDRDQVVYEDTSGCNGMRFQYNIKAISNDGVVTTDTSGIHVEEKR